MGTLNAALAQLITSTWAAANGSPTPLGVTHIAADQVDLAAHLGDQQYEAENRGKHEKGDEIDGNAQPSPRPHQREGGGKRASGRALRIEEAQALQDDRRR